MGDNTNTKPLVDMLAERIGCTYISDLSFLSRRGRKRLLPVILNTPVENYSLWQWNVALEFIAGQKAEASAAAAREKLIKYLRGG